MAVGGTNDPSTPRQRTLAGRSGCRPQRLEGSSRARRSRVEGRRSGAPGLPGGLHAAGVLAEGRDGGWWFHGWAVPSIMAGVSPRHLEPAACLRLLPPGVRTASAEQVHGGSVAVLGRFEADGPPVPGCDALVTGTAGVALFIRTADCLPILFADPSRGVIGIAHAGWRGLAAELPARVLAVLRHVYHTRIDDLWVAIGPAIRACCYEVGPEFVESFGPFVQERAGRRTCDLIGAASTALRQCGIRPAHLCDSGLCTACEAQRWFSVRRDGPATGRMVSFIAVKP